LLRLATSSPVTTRPCDIVRRASRFFLCRRRLLLRFSPSRRRARSSSPRRRLLLCRATPTQRNSLRRPTRKDLAGIKSAAPRTKVADAHQARFGLCFASRCNANVVATLSAHQGLNELRHGPSPLRISVPRWPTTAPLCHQLRRRLDLASDPTIIPGHAITASVMLSRHTLDATCSLIGSKQPQLPTSCPTARDRRRCNSADRCVHRPTFIPHLK
jgi:hypothetical protein